jgi:hypothetical protein
MFAASALLLLRSLERPATLKELAESKPLTPNIIQEQERRETISTDASSRQRRKCLTPELTGRAINLMKRQVDDKKQANCASGSMSC